MTTTSPYANPLFVLPSIITKLMLKAQTTEILSDGTKTIVYKGFISPMDAHLVYLAQATNDNGLERHTKHHVVFSAKGDSFDWSVKQNYVPKDGKFYITFVMNDYTIPAQKEATIKKLARSFELEVEWLEYLLMHDLQTGQRHPLTIENVKATIQEKAQALADFTV